MEGRLIDVDGVKIFVSEGGKGKSLVLLHGLGGPLMWQKFIPLAEKEFHVVDIHLPGFGESGKPEGEYTISYFVQILSNVLQHLVLNNPILVGVSLGGRIAAEVALLHQQEIESLVLIASTGSSGAAPMLKNSLLWKMFQWFARSIFLQNKFFMCTLSRKSFHTIANRPADLCEKTFTQINRPGGCEAWISSFHNTIERDDSFLNKLRRLDVRTLVVWGENDRLLPVDNAYVFCQVIERSTLAFFPACGHSVPLEKPEQLLKALKNFVEKKN